MWRQGKQPPITTMAPQSAKHTQLLKILVTDEAVLIGSALVRHLALQRRRVAPMRP